MAVKPPDPPKVEETEPAKPPVLRIYDKLKAVAELLFGWIFK